MADAPLETPAVTPEAPVTPETLAPEPKPETPPRQYTQAEVDEIVGKVKTNARRRAEELRRDREVFKRMAFEKTASPPAPPQAPVQTEEPKLEQFQSYDDYVKAMAKHEAGKHVKEMTEAERKEQQQAAQRQQAQKVLIEHQARQAKATEKYEDYEEVAFGNPHMPEHMVRAIIESETGPELAYWLGKNLAESERISKLSPILAIKELGKIEAKLEAPPPVPAKPSSAPAPIVPIGGKAGSPTSDEPSEKDPIGVWIAKRNKQVHGKRAF